MKYRTFRTLALGGLVVLGGGAVFLATRHPEPAIEKVERPRSTTAPTPPPPTPPPNPIPTPTSTPTPTPSPNANASPSPSPNPTSPPGDALRPVDQDILARVKTGIPGDKLTDAFRGKPYKVNLYKDAGQTSVNRLKIDLDRDGKWDEKWNLEPDGRVKRQVAPADDESYTESYVLEGDHWKRKE